MNQTMTDSCCSANRSFIGLSTDCRYPIPGQCCKRYQESTRVTRCPLLRTAFTSDILQKRLRWRMRIDSTLTTRMPSTCPCLLLSVRSFVFRSFTQYLLVSCGLEGLSADQYSRLFVCRTSTVRRGEVFVWCGYHNKSVSDRFLL
jgi:hypothetical protein